MGNTNSTKPQEEHHDDPFFTCELCIEPMLSNNKKFRNSNLCLHPFCNECVTKYVLFKINDEGVAGIKCPGLNCDKLLDPLRCRALIPSGVFDRWCDLLCERTLLGLDRCYCPNRVCSAAVVNECGGIVKKSMCPGCKEWFCFKCKVAWHEAYRCEELRDSSDVAFADIVRRKKWKRCPECRHCVELVHGCSVVKCRCGSKFCYQCGRKMHTCNCQDTAWMVRPAWAQDTAWLVRPAWAQDTAGLARPTRAQDTAGLARPARAQDTAGLARPARAQDTAGLARPAWAPWAPLISVSILFLLVVFLFLVVCRHDLVYCRA